MSFNSLLLVFLIVYVTMEPFQDSFRWKYGLQPLEYDDAGLIIVPFINL
jgi:hypothetical protein